MHINKTEAEVVKAYIESVQQMLEFYTSTGEILEDDISLAAHQFMETLRGAEDYELVGYNPEDDFR